MKNSTHCRTYEIQDHDIAEIILYLDYEGDIVDPDAPSSEYRAVYFDDCHEIMYTRRFSTYPDFEDLMNA